jgi:hypothetical protein
MQQEDQFLDCLHDLQKATPKPYMATRVKAKYANINQVKNKWQAALPWAIATVFLFNALLLWQTNNDQSTNAEAEDAYVGAEVSNNYNYINQLIEDEK